MLRSYITISRLWGTSIAVAFVFTFNAHAACELVPSPTGRLVGREFNYVVRPGDTLSSLGRHYGVAVRVLIAANGLKRDSPLRSGAVLQIDGRHVVPDTLANGILINIPQRLLLCSKTVV